jgi:hypothetical protein
MSDKLFDNAERLSAVAAIALPSIKPVKRIPRSDAKQAERLRALTAEGYIVKVGKTGVTVFGRGNA